MRLVDLLLPARCVVCSAFGELVCEQCAEGLPRLRAPLCARCGAPTAWPVARCRECAGRRLAFASARAAVAYDDHVRTLVAAWKEQGLRALARFAAASVVELVERPDAEALVPVPSDRDRTLVRGHHAAEALARELGRSWGMPLAPLLHRARPVPRQRGLALAERRRNVRGAFVTGERPPPRVVLVDDVYTTGSTVAAAASALRRAGARRVDVVTFARTIRAR